MSKRVASVVILFFAAAITADLAPAVASAAPTITLVTQFDYPATGWVTTKPHAINNGGDIVGSVYFYRGIKAGFERFSNGTFAELQDPYGQTDTEGTGINDLGEIVGYYDNAASSLTGFELVGGVYSDFLNSPDRCPSSTACPALLNGTNDSGNVVGAWFLPHGVEQAFAMLNGVFTPLTSPLLAHGAVANAISNNSHRVVGLYYDGAVHHGFVYTVATDSTSAIDLPGAVQTEVYGINNQGTITGHDTDSSGVVHGFARIQGQFVTYDYPGANNFTTLERVNDSNLAVGGYKDSIGLIHGLLLQISLS